MVAGSAVGGSVGAMVGGTSVGAGSSVGGTVGGLAGTAVAGSSVGDAGAKVSVGCVVCVSVGAPVPAAVFLGAAVAARGVAVGEGAQAMTHRTTAVSAGQKAYLLKTFMARLYRAVPICHIGCQADNRCETPHPNVRARRFGRHVHLSNLLALCLIVVFDVLDWRWT